MTQKPQHTDFPVAVEKELVEARKRLYGIFPSKRDLSELPRQVPGTVYIFHDGSRWTQARGGRLKGTEDYVVDAIAVSLVWARPRDVDVDIAIPSKGHADEFTVVATFTVRVTDAALVAKQGPVDVVGRLRTFLKRDRDLQAKGVQYLVDEVHQVRDEVQARVRAYCEVELPQIPGLEVTLNAVQILTPKDLADHDRGMRDVRWTYERKLSEARKEREVVEYIGRHHDADAQVLADRFRNDPEYLKALAYVSKEVNIERLYLDASADRVAKDANLLEILKLLEKNGQLDLLPIDGQHLVARLMERLVGAVPSAVATGPIRADASVGPDGRTAIDTEVTAPDQSSTEDRFQVADED